MTLALQARPTATVKLRPYQLEAREAVALAWSEERDGAPMVVLPTGCGKTVFGLSLVVDELAAGGRVIWLAHRTELLTQPLEALAAIWPEHASDAGIVQAAKDDADRRVVFASVDTLRNKRRRDRVLKHGRPTLVVVDEAHHSVAKTQRKVIEGLGAPNMLGLTATPDRSDGKDLSDLWEIAYAYPLSQAIADGWLVPPFAAVCPVPDLDPATLAGLSDEEQGDALIAAHIVDHTANVLAAAAHHAIRLPDRDGTALLRPRGRRWFVFTASVKQAKLTAERLEQDGWRARWASGEMGTDDRRRFLRALGDGQIDVLVSPMIFTEGTDCPAVDGVVLARACASWSTLVQCVGRGLRLHDPNWKGPGINANHPAYKGKTECLVIDLAGATDVHDLRSPPVLIGGSKCPEAPNGVHRFVENENGKGACEICGKTVACFAALKHGESAHRWVDGDTRHCEFCKRQQCEGNPDGRHDWQPLEKTQICLGCGLEIRLRDGMLRRRRLEEPCKEAPDGKHDCQGSDVCQFCGELASALDTAWLRVPAVRPELWVVDINEHGLVFIRADRNAGTCEPIWLRKGSTKPRKLSSSPIPLTDARAWTDHLVRAAAKISSRQAGWRKQPATGKQLDYLVQVATPHAGAPWLAYQRRVFHQRGPTAGDVANAITLVRARERALATGIAEEVAP